MSEGLIKTIIICVTVFLCSLVLGLCSIAIIRDDGSEAQIVTGLLAVVAIIVPIAYVLVQHWLGSKALINAVAASQSSAVAEEAKP